MIKLSSKLGRVKTLWGGVKFLDNIPRLPNGKYAITKLKEMAKKYAE